MASTRICQGCGVEYVPKYSGNKLDFHDLACYKAHQPVKKAGELWACTKCGTQKPLTAEFWLSTKNLKTHPSGFLAICRDCRRTLHKNDMVRIKLATLTVYGGDPPRCYCCGETNVGFLTMDHTNNDGAAHRRLIGTGSQSIYYWLKKHRYPADLGLQVACFNCNAGRHWNGGVCPHKT